MEEKKLTPKGSKKVEEKDNNQKLTYEQLNEACSQLYQQNQVLLKQIRQIETTNFFKRFDYLFKVLEFAHIFDDGNFINRCADEIKENLYPEKEEEQENK